ncbi:MAG: hypothetical protein HY332_16750 [Chloroflexi bacterium]|nr:hypothetical protein [Chloroflexota bacterium]
MRSLCSGRASYARVRAALMPFVAAVTALGLGLGIAPSPAAACSCLPVTPQELAARADAVFTGTAVSVVVHPLGAGSLDQFDNRVETRFAVESAYKGPVGQSMTVVTRGSPGLCGIVFGEGGRYTVFASGATRSDGGFAAGSGTYSTHLCAGTRAGDVDPARYGLALQPVAVEPADEDEQTSDVAAAEPAPPEPPTGAWTAAALSQPRSELTGAVVGTQALFAGGRTAEGEYSDVVDMYDASTGEWSTAALSRGRAGIAAATAGTLVLFAGGRDVSGPSTDVVDVYDSVTGEWRVTALPRVREVRLVSTVGTSVVFVGGTAVTPNAYSPVVADVYDGANGTWMAATPALASWDQALAVVADRLLIAGGAARCGKPCVGLSSGQAAIYDGATGRWSGATLSQARWGVATATVNGRVLFTGGTFEVTNALETQVTNAVDLYDATTGRWSTASLFQARSAPAAAVAGSQVLFAGGAAGSQPSELVDIYDANLDQWRLARLAEPRAGLTVATVGTKALFAGGRTQLDFQPQSVSPVVDIYDAATGEWTVAQLSQARAQLGARAAGRKVLFFDRGESPAAVVDIYDAGTGEWSTATLSIARAMPAVATVGETAIFAGGHDGTGPSAAVDLYHSAQTEAPRPVAPRLSQSE